MIVHHEALRRTALSAALVGFGAAPLHEAGSTGEALMCARAWGPCDLAVVHLGLPDGAAMSLVDELGDAGWERVVVVAVAGSAAEAAEAFGRGARGYLVDGDQGGPGLVLRGTAEPVPGLTAARGAPVRVAGRHGMRRDLSAREVQVLQLVAHGQSNRDVGEHLQLSALTVKSHLSRISRKLGTGDRAELVALAMRAGIIS